MNRILNRGFRIVDKFSPFGVDPFSEERQNNPLKCGLYYALFLNR